MTRKVDRDFPDTDWGDEDKITRFERLLDFFSSWRLILLWMWRGRVRSFKQWVIRTFMRDLHDGHDQLFRDYQFLQKEFRDFRIVVVDHGGALQAQRAQLTDILIGLVAKDDDGNWTTVFDADTRLPDEHQQFLNVLVGRA